MAKRAGQPLYQGIVDDLKQRIERQELAAGDQLLSIGEMSRSYNVSAITAKRAISELQGRGWVHSIKGKGTFVVRRVREDHAPRRRAAVRTIVLVTSSAEALRLRGFMAEIWESVERSAADLGAGFRLQILPTSAQEAHLDLLLRPTPGEGFLLLTVGPLHRALAYLHDHAVPAALVDAAGAGCHGVATDNADGMRQLIDHLHALGHRRLHLAAWSPRASNSTNENERLAAFQLFCADRGLEGSVSHSDKPSLLLERLHKNNAPTAVMFTLDDPAVEFILAARQSGLRVPEDLSVVGFDGWAGRHREFHGLTTLEVDRAGLGRAAVELLLRRDLPDPLQYQCLRVPGRLLVGATAGPAPNKGKRG